MAVDPRLILALDEARAKKKDPRIIKALEAELADQEQNGYGGNIYPTYANMVQARTTPKLVKVDPAKVNVAPPKKAPEEKYDPTEGMAWWQKGLAGVGSGLTNVGRGTYQTALAGANMIPFLPENIAQWVSKEKDANQAEIDAQAKRDEALLDTGWGMAGNIVGQAAPTALIPGGFAAGSALRAAGMGAAQGAANAALTSRTSDVDPLMHLGLNAGAGAVFNPLIYQAGKVVNAIRGKVRPGMERASEMARDALNRGIKTTIGDVLPESGWRRFEDFSEYLPFSGRRSFMKKQAEQTGKAIEEFGAKYNPKPNEDPGRKMAEGVIDEYTSRRATAKTLFDEVSAAAKENGVDFITPERTHGATARLRKEFPELAANFGDKKVEDSLQLVDKLLSPDGLKKHGAPTFDFMRELRSDVGSLLRQAEKKAAHGNINERAVKRLSELYAAINDDLAKWGTEGAANQKVMTVFKKASDYYKDSIDPYKRIPILNELRFLDKDNLGTFDTDRLLSMVFAKDRPARASQVLDFMTEDGRKAAQGAVVDRAKRAALDPNLESGLSTLEFLRKMDTGRTRGAVFPDATDLQGMENAVRASRRAAEFTHNPPTGARNALPTVINSITGLAPLGLGAAGFDLPAIAVGPSLAAAVNLANRYSATNAAKRLALADPEKFPATVKLLMNPAGPALADYVYGLLGE